MQTVISDGHAEELESNTADIASREMNSRQLEEEEVCYETMDGYISVNNTLIGKEFCTHVTIPKLWIWYTV